MEIRCARRDDKDSIREIYESVAGRQASLDESLRDRLIEAGAVLVAEEGGQVVGFGSIEVSAVEHVRWLYVSPKHQRGEIGSKILKQLERTGWEAGLSSIRLHAAPAAVGFYRKNGYSQVAAGGQVCHDHDGVEMMKERRS